MSSTKKILILLGILSLFGLFFVSMVYAQENTEIQPEELEIKAPQILSTSGIYPIKEFFRKVRFAFTFSPVKKAELRLKFSNEKLMEVKELAKDEKNKELIEKTLSSYQEEMEKLKNETEKLAEQEKGKFIEKYIDHTLKQQMVLENIASQVKGEVYEKILANRERHLERFQEVMEKVENKERLREQIRATVREMTDVSQARALKVLETIKEIEEKSPEEVKEEIKNLKEEVLNNIVQRLKELPEEVRETKLKEQLKIFANPLTAEEIIEEIKEKDSEIVLTPEITATSFQILQEKLSTLPEAKQMDVLEKLTQGKIKHLERLQEIKEKLEALPTSPIAPSIIEKVIEKQLEKLEKKIEKIETLPESTQEKLKEELEEAPKIKEKIMERRKEEGMIKEKKKCLKEGESSGPVVAPEFIPKDAVYECCEGLIKYIPKGLAGSGGTCIKKEKCAEIAGSICVELKSDFCGRSTYGSCKTDEDCLKGGCSSQVCQAKNEESIITTCEWRDCYNAETYGVRCGCFNSKCQWGK